MRLECVRQERCVREELRLGTRACGILGAVLLLDEVERAELADEHKRLGLCGGLCGAEQLARSVATHGSVAKAETARRDFPHEGVVVVGRLKDDVAEPSLFGRCTRGRLVGEALLHKLTRSFFRDEKEAGAAACGQRRRRRRERDEQRRVRVAWGGSRCCFCRGSRCCFCRGRRRF
jgi:hypothetical protein